MEGNNKMKEIKNNSLYIDIELPDGFVKDAMNKKTKRYLSALKEDFENLLFLPTWFKKEKIKFDGENFKVEINSTFKSLKPAIIYPSYYNEYSDSPYYKKDRHDDETSFFIDEFLNKLKSPQISEEE